MSEGGIEREEDREGKREERREGGKQGRDTFFFFR